MKNKKVEEVSVGASISGHSNPFKELDEELLEFVDEAQQEEALREAIRSSLSKYSEHKKMLRVESKKEEEFREVIRNLILQEKRSNLPPASSTLEGRLRDFLTNSNPTILGDMNSLATAPEEKKGYIDTLLVGISSIFEIAAMNSKESSEEPAETSELNEEEEEKIIFSNPSDELETRPVMGVDDPDKEENEEEEVIGSQSQEERGSKQADDTLKQIEGNVKKMLDGLVVDEFEAGRDAVLRNVGAWIIKWHKKDPTITKYVTDTLDKLDSSLPAENLEDQESQISEPVGS